MFHIPAKWYGSRAWKLDSSFIISYFCQMALWIYKWRWTLWTWSRALSLTTGGWGIFSSSAGWILTLAALRVIFQQQGTRLRKCYPSLDDQWRWLVSCFRHFNFVRVKCCVLVLETHREVMLAVEETCRSNVFTKKLTVIVMLVFTWGLRLGQCIVKFLLTICATGRFLGFVNISKEC